ncbi:MAG: hypothetical protein ISS82_03345 [Nanoarchaeota archaeon]|nr:hypothetical protein [Nanoarchaeota archaeon]
MNKISEDLKELVIVRLETMPSNRKISIGSYGDFNKEELIKHVKEGDEVGKKIIEVELEFIRTLKEGIITW